MKNSRRLLAFLLNFSIILALNMPANAMESEKSDPLLPHSEAQVILAEFDNEIKHIETKYGILIDEIDSKLFQIIKKEAALNLQNEALHYATLVDTIVRALSRNRDQDQIKPFSFKRNESRTEYIGFGALKGIHIRDVAVGTSETYGANATISVASGELLKGVKINTQFSLSGSYTISGPSDGTQLLNDMYATHRMAFGVLYGSIWKYEYDLYSDYVGGLSGHVVQYYINPDSAVFTTYTTLVVLSTPTYIEKASRNSVLTFSNINTMRSSLVSNPGNFV